MAADAQGVQRSRRAAGFNARGCQHTIRLGARFELSSLPIGRLRRKPNIGSIRPEYRTAYPGGERPPRAVRC